MTRRDKDLATNHRSTGTSPDRGRTKPAFPRTGAIRRSPGRCLQPGLNQFANPRDGRRRAAGRQVRRQVADCLSRIAGRAEIVSLLPDGQLQSGIVPKGAGLVSWHGYQWP